MVAAIRLRFLGLDPNFGSMFSLLHRHYPLRDLNFRDFWDICSHFQRIHPKYKHILYTVEGYGLKICEDEEDISVVMREVSKVDGQVQKYIARYYQSPFSEPGDYGNAKMVYLPESADFQEGGLHFYSESDDKLLIYNFEHFIYNSYETIDTAGVDIEYGMPCEVVTCVIDMRGFTLFCNRPEIESPYTCGLLTAFYDTVRKGFKRYPPELLKFLGDGVLAVWQTEPRDRQIAIETCVEGLANLPSRWSTAIEGPEFSHGAPEGVGSGIAFGLASKITIDNDYIGRPINLAARLCGKCPPAKTYVDKSVPGVGGFDTKQVNLDLKSFGEHKVWMLENA